MIKTKSIRNINILAAVLFFLVGCSKFGSLPSSQYQYLPGADTADPGESAISSLQDLPTSSSGEINPGGPDAGGFLSYPIVDSGQTSCYNNSSVIPCPGEGEDFFGQDAQYEGNFPRYQDNGDGTVTDLVTGLIWQQDPGDKMTYEQAVANADTFLLAGYDDWRLPTINELYSLILFTGMDPSGPNISDTSSLIPFIDTDYFDFEYGDPTAGERIIDSQWVSSTVYVGSSSRDPLVFGVNFADGRIKGYGTTGHPSQPDGKTFFVLYVRGNSAYGENQFVDNQNGTISDLATGLMWTQSDSGTGMAWEDSLKYCETLEAGGMGDWRLPNAKELQSIVDYARSPEKTNSAAISPVFSVTTIRDETGAMDYPYYWSSTTHANLFNGSNAVYISFGKALGYMQNDWVNVHGAGAQRSDPKTGDAGQFPNGHGPQGDAIRIENFVRCVRDGAQASSASSGAVSDKSFSPGASGASPSQLPSGLERDEPDLSSAAAILGVSSQALREVLGPPPPDLAAAAKSLSVSEEVLREALGHPSDPLVGNP